MFKFLRRRSKDEKWFENNSAPAPTVRPRGRGRRWLAIILLLAVFGGGIWAGQYIRIRGAGLVIEGAKDSPKSGTVQNTAELPDYLKKDVNFALFWQVWNLVKDKYYQKDIPETKLFYGALAGIVASVGDPYSVFMTPQDSNDFQKELSGSFEGIGAEIGLKNNYLTIIAPLPDTPAARAGLRAQDIIVKIDGQDTTGMSTDKGVSLIRGKKGTTVKLTVFRDGWSEPKELAIVRDTITVKSVTLEFKNDNIAYIKMRQFNDDTVPLFDSAIGQILGKSSVKGIILDLRNDPGGYLDSAVAVAGEWVDGQTVVSEKLRDGSETKHVSDRQARLSGYPTVVLVDGGSASASEIVAGALQDYGQAKIVGAKTFGKGSVQDLTMLSDGSSVKLTIAKWYTPKGRSIQDEGIEPDVKVELKEEDYNKGNDPQLAKALSLLGEMVK